MGRLALEVDPELRCRLGERFGNDILNADGMIIRPRLAAAAFSSPEGQRDLTRITFPTLYRLAREHLNNLAVHNKVIVFDAALIYEWGVENDFDKIVVVTATRDILIQRAIKRLGISEMEAEDRLCTQIPSHEKEQRADWVIVNDNDIIQLKRKASELWVQLLGK